MHRSKERRYSITSSAMESAPAGNGAAKKVADQLLRILLG
jgi:hypothetical protein